ncbi:MAG TPA: winged helix-turn-helix domain-containing protein [Candidatus Binatia bacterium]|nr:winged helix-turn-helix domain-containing protein [Candidatus Binatia bacterium]
MTDVRNSPEIVRFGPFELDGAAGELRKDGSKIRLQEQPLQVLQVLLEQAGRVVPREELQRRIWPADTFVDFDHGINNAIKRLREALGDTSETPRYVETLPRRGYRFIETLSAATKPGVEEMRSIAVLPFLNLSSDPENEFFCDGTTEEIISALAQIKKLHVVARTSAFAFKGKHVDLRSVGQQLNVRTILEGSIRRSGDRLRITAQLVNAADGYHLWSEKYDREVKDVFVVQEEIANSIAQRLEVSLDSDRQLFRAGTASLEAFKFYTRGRALFFQRGVRLLSAVECFEKAVALDNKYALAWSGLADGLNSSAFYGLIKPGVSLPRAKEAAQQAIELNPSLGEAHTSLALSHLFHDWDRASAERQFLRSLELQPQNLLARVWYGMYCLQWAAGRFEEGLAQAREAVNMDPLSAWFRGMLGVTYLPIDPEKSVETALETLRIDPESFLGRWVQMTGLNALGRYSEAAEIGELSIRMFGRPLWFMASLARSYARLGRSDDSRALYMELCWRAKREYVAPVFFGLAAFAADERDEGFRQLQKAHEIGDPAVIGLRYWPDHVEMREDSRLQEILRSRVWT